MSKQRGKDRLLPSSSLLILKLESGLAKLGLNDSKFEKCQLLK